MMFDNQALIGERERNLQEDPRKQAPPLDLTPRSATFGFDHTSLFSQALFRSSLRTEPSDMVMVKCTRKGCGQEFDPASNSENACNFHPGAPVQTL
jgi:hypothetical protein